MDRHAGLLLAVCLGVSACAPQTLRRLTLVPTKTPGLTYVVVHPTDDQKESGVLTPGNGNKLSRGADYILLCDGRQQDGMRCEIPEEVAITRFSANPKAASAPTKIDEEISGAVVVGSGDYSLQGQTTVYNQKAAEEQPAPAQSAAAPAAPPPAAPTPAQGEKK